MDTPDTLTLARVDRENQGPWEAEYSYGGEADLHLHYDKCEKNPGHKNFIPVDKFSIEDLPENYRDQDMMDYIRAQSDLTVRVTVKYVSDRRPETVPDSDIPYPGYNVRGHWRMTVGTGYVIRVGKNNDGERLTCKCKDCANSGTQETNFAVIYILTAKHVVFDNLEAEHTTCHLFFDRGSTPDTCSGVITLTGMSILTLESPEFQTELMHRDTCFMAHFTHDLGLAQRIDKMCKLREEKKSKIYNKKYHKYKYTWRQAPADKQPFCFLVSHPHGCSKQISLGGFTSVYTFNSKVTSYLYSTDTCPGSSGAHISVIRGLLTPLSFSHLPCHCGAADAQPGMNYCHHPPYLDPVIWQNFQWKPMTMEILQLDGSAEYNLHCGVEEDLHKHDDTCPRNPGHQNFFPAQKFSMDNLPLSYRMPKIMEFIKLMSDLTVRVSVKSVSEERPETVPGTDITHQRYSNRGDNQVRVGSGWVDWVDKYMHEICDCKQCFNSPSPKTKFAHINIKTGAEFDYIRLEREHVTCLLSFSSNTPGICEDVVTLTDLCKIKSGKWGNTFSLTCLTHDLDLADRLESKTQSFSRLQTQFLKITKYSSLMRDMTEQVGKNPEQESPLYIVVSYPHGCTKQVSIRYHGNGGNSDTEKDWCPYTSITCPGSIGAPTFVFGGEYLYPYSN